MHPSRFVSLPCLDGTATDEDGNLMLNRRSHFLTKGHDFPAAQAMLFAAGVPDQKTMKTFPQVGVASVWWEGNPCNMHLLDLGRDVKRELEKEGMLGWQYNTVGVSDAITMGSDAMRYSLQSREIIADSIETVTIAQRHDACIAIGGCDKNMPAILMAFARHNCPSIMIYGGTIKPGFSSVLGRNINISTCFSALGAQSYGKLTSTSFSPRQNEEGKPFTADEILGDIERHACPGPGGCGGMYTANTMSAAIETMGLSLPGSSSLAATSPSKARECARVAKAIKVCLELNIRPRDLITRASLENAIAMIMVLGGSTNAVIHLLAIAVAAEVDLNIDDFQRISDKTPFLARLAPNGPYHVADLAQIGGMSAIHRYLISAGVLDGSVMTVTGKTLAENVANAPEIDFSADSKQDIMCPLEKPLKASGHIRVLKGNLAPGGAVAKISGQEGLRFVGKAIVFNKEHELNTALERGEVPTKENHVLVVRYEGPKGGPGMPEQLKASGAIMGAGLTNIALITDGRYSGASHGFIVGHIVPEAAVGGPIALVRNGDMITIDAETNQILVDVSDEEMAERRKGWSAPEPPVTRGALAKYAHLVGDASHGCVTDLF